MFRTQENIPEIYVNESRDFQLLCRLKDAIQGATKYNIDSLRHLSNTLEMNSTLLPLLKSKVGFFKEEQLSEDQLRYLLTGFPYLVKYKGSKKAIESAIYLWFRVNRIGGKLISVLINNSTYEININIDTPPQDTSLLDALFDYLVPTGYVISYNFAGQFEFSSDYQVQTYLRAGTIDPRANSQMRTDTPDETLENLQGITTDANKTSFAKEVIGAIGTTQIYKKEES